MLANARACGLHLLAFVLALACVALPTFAAVQDYPNRIVKVIMPLESGDGLGTFLKDDRALAERLVKASGLGAQ